MASDTASLKVAVIVEVPPFSATAVLFTDNVTLGASAVLFNTLTFNVWVSFEPFASATFTITS